MKKRLELGPFGALVSAVRQASSASIVPTMEIGGTTR
jgi:hypothetical protein